jgi:hypothetical protein
LLRVQASPKKHERKEGNMPGIMPTTPLDIINCTPEEFFHQMVITNLIRRTSSRTLLSAIREDLSTV